MPQLTQVDANETVRILTVLTQVDGVGTVRTLKELWQNDAGNVPRRIFAGFSMVVSPGVVRGFGNSASFITIPTPYVTATVQGGTPPYSYDWEQLTVGTGWSATSPNSASTAFRKTNVPPGGADQSSTWQLTVTDSSGAVLTSGMIGASVINLYAA